MKDSFQISDFHFGGRGWSFSSINEARAVFDTLMAKREFSENRQQCTAATIMIEEGRPAFIFLWLSGLMPDFIAMVGRLALVAGGSEMTGATAEDILQKAGLRWKTKRGQFPNEKPFPGLITQRHNTPQPWNELTDEVTQRAREKASYTRYIFEIPYADRPKLKKLLREAQNVKGEDVMTGLSVLVNNLHPQKIYVICAFKTETSDSRAWCERYRALLNSQVRYEDLIKGIEEKTFNLMTFPRHVSPEEVDQIFFSV